LLFLSLGQPARARWRTDGTLLLALPVGWAGSVWLHATGAKAGIFRWGYALAHSTELWTAFKASAVTQVIESGGFLAVCALAGLLWMGAARRSSRAAWALGAWTIALLGSLAICLLMGLGGRYLLFPLWGLLLMTPALVAMRWPGLGPASMLLPALLGLLWLARPIPAETPLELRQAAWMDQMAEQRGLSYGIADYFHSRPLRLFSHRSLQVLPMLTPNAGLLIPHLWVVDRRLFPDDRLQAKPQFAVMNGLDPLAVRANLGQPKEVLQNEGLELWLFKDVPKEQR
jgi:hypothetical protein